MVQIEPDIVLGGRHPSERRGAFKDRDPLLPVILPREAGGQSLHPKRAATMSWLLTSSGPSSDLFARS
jgi:hypothetical protein